MEILNIQDTQARSTALNLCKNLIEKNVLIPVVGSGFSFGSATDNKGRIPSANDFRLKLLEYIVQYSGYSAEEIKEIEKYSLSDIADVFWSIYLRIPQESLSSYFSYIEQNFLDVSYFSSFQEAFLNVHWPYIFTLNYDSLIENYSAEYYPIIPFDSINHQYNPKKTKLYKLHGDAKKYCITGDKKYLILSRDQYVKSMMDANNSDMLSELQTAFSSKSILFFGCGLSEELDLLYSSQLALDEKIKSIDPAHQAVIYISFEHGKDGTSDFPLRTKDRLLNYGVTHVLRIFTEDQSTAFFSELAEYSKRVANPRNDSFLELHSSMRYNTLQANDKNSREFMLNENLVWRGFRNHIITLPSYGILRSKLEEIINTVISGSPICFISGNFFSGKTFLLIELSKYFSTRKVYLFPSGTNLTNAQLDGLLQKEDSLLCFDSKSLSTAQIKRLSQRTELDRIRMRHSCAVIVIDASDAPMYKYIFEARNTAQDFPQIRVSGIFDNKEGADFNQKLGAMSFPPYSNGETILDYVVRNEKELIMASDTDNYFLEPQRELLAKNALGRIKALIMLVTEIRISAKRAILFGIDGHINDMIRICRENNGVSVIEKDYSVYTGDSSGYEFVCNSKYWVIRSLSIYAKSQANSINTVARAYEEIINVYSRVNTNRVVFYQECEPYYFFDHIQLLFNQRWFPNSSKLMNAIYDCLLPALSDSYQFLHQKAKGKLIIAQVQLKNERYYDGKETLKEALFNITRAIKLAEQYPDARNIKETLLHMVYTKGRILIEYGCIAKKFIPQAIDVCYQLYEMQKDVKHDAYDFTTGTGNDRISFEKFKSILIQDTSIRRFSDLDMEKTEFLIKRWTKMNFKITKKRRPR